MQSHTGHGVHSSRDCLQVAAAVSCTEMIICNNLAASVRYFIFLLCRGNCCLKHECKTSCV